MESCGQECLKYLMFIFNFLFFLCGGVLLGLGIWVIVDGKSFMDVVGSNPIIFNGVYIIIAVGVALFLISFLGCCGAIKENRCMLGTFFVIVLVIFILQIVGAILAFVYYPDVEKFALGSISKYNTSSVSPEDRAITDGWNTMQAVFGCCGFKNLSDWEQLNSDFKQKDKLVPESCCLRDRFSLDGIIVNQTNCQSLKDDFYDKACETKIKQYYWAVGGAGLGILVVELLAMIFACCLYRAAGEKDDYA